MVLASTTENLRTQVAKWLLLQAQDVVEWVIEVFDEELGGDTVLAASWANTSVVLKVYLQQGLCCGGKSCQGCSDLFQDHSHFTLRPFCAVFSQSLW